MKERNPRPGPSVGASLDRKGWNVSRPHIPASLRARFAAPLRWWRGLEPAERVLYRGSVLLTAGLAMVSIPAALIAAGAVFLAVFFGFDLRRRA